MTSRQNGLVANVKSFVRNNRTFVAVLLLFLITVPIAYSFRSGQSYLVDARTLGARIDVEGVGTSWQLYGVTHCQRLTDPERLTDALAAAASGGTEIDPTQPETLCSPMLFQQSDLHSAVAFAVPDGATIALAATPEGGLMLSQPAGSARTQINLGAAGTWNPDDVLIVSRNGWRSTGALEFRGNVRIGDEVAQGTQGYLLEGSYEVREKFRRQQLIQGFLDLIGSDASAGQPIPILTGDLMRGDQLTFERNGQPGVLGFCVGGDGPAASGERLASTVPAQGFVVPVLDTDLSGFALRVTSNAAQSCARLRLNSYGAQTRYIAPTWTDRALLDPLLLAFLTIGGFLVGVLTLLVEIAEIVRQREEATEQANDDKGPSGSGDSNAGDGKPAAPPAPAESIEQPQAGTLVPAASSQPTLQAPQETAEAGRDTHPERPEPT